MSVDVDRKRAETSTDEDVSVRYGDGELHAVFDHIVGASGLELPNWGGASVSTLSGHPLKPNKGQRLPPPPEDKPSHDGYDELMDEIGDTLEGSPRFRLRSAAQVGKQTVSSQAVLEIEPPTILDSDFETSANPKYQRQEAAPLVGRTVFVNMDLPGIAYG